MELKKFRLLFDKDVEQDWLNAMCQKGWALKNFFLGVYTFEPCKPGEYTYQVDLLPGSGFQASDPEGYIEFMEETGVEVVCRWFRWIILRKPTEDGPFEIYTDIDSHIQMYSRIRTMFLWGLGLEVCCSFSIWPQIWRGELFLYILAAFYVLIFVAFLKAIATCSHRITALQQKQ